MPVHSEFDRVSVVLVSTRNPLNIGAAARAMSNFGFTQLRVVTPYEPSFREARSAVGAAELLANATEYASVAEAVADCTLVVGTTAAGQRDLQHPLRPLEEGAAMLHEHLSVKSKKAGNRVALLFGSEKRGLSNDDLSHCHWLMRIPTREAHGSMNLGQAVAVCLYELARRFSGNPEMESTAQRLDSRLQDAAVAGDIERITAVLLDVLRESGYLIPRAQAPTEEKIRRLVRHLHLNTHDAEVWLGMLRQILWKLKQSEPQMNADKR